MLIERFSWRLALLVLIAATVLGTGCVTNGRQVLLKEYGPSIPALTDSSLKGSTIYIKGFNSASNSVSLEVKTKPEEPNQFKHADLTREQNQLWEKEMNALRKQTAQANWRKIGNLRNGYGMVMSHV